MSFILFIDESGHDGKVSPYEVLAGVAIEDRDLWNLIRAIQQTELDCFGRRYPDGPSELKGKKILKSKVFRHAKMRGPFDPRDRRDLARRCLDQGESATPDQPAALGQAKIDFVRRVLILCAQHHCHAFASIVPRRAPGRRPGPISGRTMPICSNGSSISSKTSRRTPRDSSSSTRPSDPPAIS